MANDSIGSMTAIVRATADQFSSDMKQVESSLGEVAEKGESAGSRLKEAFEIAGAFELFHQGIEAARESIDGFFESIDRIGQLKNFAESVGTTTQAIQGLRYAATEFHVESEQLDTALQRMQKTLGELNAGESPQLAKTFQLIGLSMQDFVGLNAEQAFLKVGDAIKNLGNSADKAYATTTIFGRGAANLVNVFNQGSEAVNKLAAEAQAAGIVLSDDDVAAAEQAEVALKKLHEQWEAFTNHLVAAAGPTITAIADDMRQLGVYLTQHAKEVAESAIHWAKLAAEVTAVILIVPRVISGVKMIVTTLREMAEAESVVEALSGPEGIAALAIGLIAAGAAAEVISSQFDKLEHAADAALSAVKSEGEEAKKGSAQAASVLAERKKAQDDAAKALKAHDEEMKEGAKIAESVRTPLEKYNDTLAKLRELLMDGAISHEVFTRAVLKAAEAVDKLKKMRDESISNVRVSGADVSTSAGASLDIAAGRYAQDLAAQRADIARQHFDEAQKQTDILQGIQDNTTGGNGGGGSDAPIADF